MKIIGKTLKIEGKPISYIESSDGVSFVFGNAEEVNIRIDDEIFVRSIMAVGLTVISKSTINLMNRNIVIEEEEKFKN